jgi:hypothetical protein
MHLQLIPYSYHFSRPGDHDLRKVLPLYLPPTLLLRQALALGFISCSAEWILSKRWLKDLSLLLRVAAGARRYGCFGYAPHPVF